MNLYIEVHVFGNEDYDDDDDEKSIGKCVYI